MFPNDDARKQAIADYKEIYLDYHGNEALNINIQAMSTDQLIQQTQTLRQKLDAEMN